MANFRNQVVQDLVLDMRFNGGGLVSVGGTVASYVSGSPGNGVVNFESVNALNEGRYFNGLQATCAVAEDFSRPIGDLADRLLTSAAFHIDTGVCPAGTSVREQPQARSSASRQRYDGADGGERTGMSSR